MGTEKTGTGRRVTRGTLTSSEVTDDLAESRRARPGPAAWDASSAVCPARSWASARALAAVAASAAALAAASSRLTDRLFSVSKVGPVGTVAAPRRASHSSLALASSSQAPPRFAMRSSRSPTPPCVGRRHPPAAAEGLAPVARPTRPGADPLRA